MKKNCHVKLKGKRCYRMFKPILGDLNCKLFAVRIVFWLVLWENTNVRLWWENKINWIFFFKFGTEYSQKNFENIMKIFNQRIYSLWCSQLLMKKIRLGWEPKWVGNLGRENSPQTPAGLRAELAPGNRNCARSSWLALLFPVPRLLKKVSANRFCGHNPGTRKISSTGIFVSAMSAKQL